MHRDGPPDSTVDLRPDPAEPALATTPASLAIGPRSARPWSEEDIRVLLRKRLLFVALLSSAALIFTLGALAYTGLPLDRSACLGVALFVPGAVLAPVLWRGRSLSLRQLRVIELVLFGGLYVLWASIHALLYPTLRWAAPPVWFGFILAYAVCLPWVFLIVAYGILIPNTWRRCAAVVGVLALTPLAISKATGLAAQATAGHSEVNFFLVLVICMAAAAAIAVYGSHRIEVLRRAVVAARRLGPYQLGRRLGAGGMGEVYLARHVLLRRPCAVKLIRSEQCGDPASLARFEREVQAMATLTHPNTAHVYDYGRAEDGTFYYAMEYLPGMTLEQLVARHGPLPPGRAIHFLRQVCGALREAHAAGLIHRDIKPGNLIVCQRGGLWDVAKLLDFGLVAAPNPQVPGGATLAEAGIVGTPAYMSAEQAAGRRDLDARSDLYSLGAVAYFLLTGEPPFPRGSLVQVLGAHQHEPAAFPERLAKDLPADVQAVVLRCLEKDPARRFADADGLDRAWAGCACAGSWGAEDAAEWWRTQAPEEDPDPNHGLEP
jgi:serine/threonine-protein kinase